MALSAVFRKIGNAHIYEAVLSSEEARGRFLDDVLALFEGRQTIMSHLVEAGKLTRKDIRDTERS